MRVFTPAVGIAAFALLTAEMFGAPELGARAGESWERPGPEELSPQTPRRARERSPLVYKSEIVPHWFHRNTRFWYRNDLREGTKEFVVVDAEKGERQPAFDHSRLAEALTRATGEAVNAAKLPFPEIAFAEDGDALIVKWEAQSWKCDLRSYACVKLTEEAAAQLREKTPPATDDSGVARAPNAPPRRSGTAGNRAVSPDGKWTALLKDQNIVLQQAEAEEWPLTTDGNTNQPYGRLEWSPDSKTLVAWQIKPAPRKEVYLIQSSPAAGGRATLQRRPYALPGDDFTRYSLRLFQVPSRTMVKPEVDEFEHEWLTPRLRWNRDGTRLRYAHTERGHQRFRLVEVDAGTGTHRDLIDERSETFIWTAHTENLRLELVNWLENSDELVYVSERDGWRHLYLVDLVAGKINRQITRGEWVVRGIDRIDETARQIWFHAGGREPNQDPYFLHYYRVNFDGSQLVALTAGNGNHAVEYSPDRRFLIDTFSRVDQPPQHALRRAADGKLLCLLETADIRDLKSSGWEAPEVFTAKGRDGKTDIWGIICRPPGFDPGKKYPVIEQIYAGPQGSYVPKTFSAQRRFASLTDLGFIVVQMDGMGTANRSKAFHDVCWKNLKDAGFPDRILWHRAAAEKYPYYDLTRVGVYGNSAGGQNAAAAVLFHPDFYRVAVASCGCHDNRMDKASWNEQWMGYPVGPQYSECSNIDHAQRLRGRLFLIVGELDNNVPPESTLRFADALIKANKDFDLLVIPGGGHGMGGNYGQRRMQDFFVRHLLGAEPPNRNAAAAN
jgi:dipeptidyl aminopeptidase/acylaminoacyl peptidase